MASFGCKQPDKTGLWTPIPEFNQPTEIMPGENIDCYSRRAGSQSGLKNDVAEKIPDKIDNLSVTSDLALKVDVTFKLTPGSTRTATVWELKIGKDSASRNTLASTLPELTFVPSTGKLSGTVTEAHANINYKVLITAKDGTGDIDSREFNFFPKKATKDGTIKFVFPYSPGRRITCGFGPRKPPAQGASSNHHGIDISQAGGELGDILAAADGTVVKAGPASGFGRWVVIEHTDSAGTLVATTVYAHMSEIYVKVGQKVGAGQKIAKEGNAGIGSGAHLHFELHKGKFKNPIDPMPYLNGTMQIADNNIPGKEGEPDPATFKTVTNENTGMTTDEVKNANQDCPVVAGGDVNKQAPPSSTTNPEPDTIAEPSPTKNNINKNRAACAPAQTASNVTFVLSEIDRALNEDPSLTAEDKKFIKQVAKIESGFDPYAKNPTSSATGLFQFLDKIATHFYAEINVPATCANRCNPYYATKAMIAFVKSAFKPYYAAYLASGKTKLAGKTIKQTEHSARYPSLTQGEFWYGLLHHDGVGTAVSGVDKGGIDYWRKKIREG